MVRTQIQFTDEQLETLRRLSAAQRRSISDLVRDSVDQMLQESDRKLRLQRFLKAAGKFSSGLPDIGENHDKYLAEDFGE